MADLVAVVNCLHTVYLDAYTIDKHEVTNSVRGAWRRVPAPRRGLRILDSPFVLRQSHHANYPVINDWYQANAHCAWL
jgi:formylglycine-generating enzyme required for sulfatase activity